MKLDLLIYLSRLRDHQFEEELDNRKALLLD